MPLFLQFENGKTAMVAEESGKAADAITNAGPGAWLTFLTMKHGNALRVRADKIVSFEQIRDDQYREAAAKDKELEDAQKRMRSGLVH